MFVIGVLGGAAITLLLIAAVIGVLNRTVTSPSGKVIIGLVCVVISIWAFLNILTGKEILHYQTVLEGLVLGAKGIAMGLIFPGLAIVIKYLLR